MVFFLKSILKVFLAVIFVGNNNHAEAITFEEALLGTIGLFAIIFG